MEIRVLHRRGMSIRAISRELKMSRKTVRKYLREPELAPVYRTWVPRPSKLDPFKAYLKMRIDEAAPRRRRGGCRRRSICGSFGNAAMTAGSRF